MGQARFHCATLLRCNQHKVVPKMLEKQLEFCKTPVFETFQTNQINFSPLMWIITATVTNSKRLNCILMTPTLSFVILFFTSLSYEPLYKMPISLF